MKAPLPTTLELTGLTMAPPQQYGAVRLIPLLRQVARDDLRLGLRRYAQPHAAVALEHERHLRGLAPEAVEQSPPAKLPGFAAVGIGRCCLGGRFRAHLPGRHPGTTGAAPGTTHTGCAASAPARGGPCQLVTALARLFPAGLACAPDSDGGGFSPGFATTGNCCFALAAGKPSS